MRAGGHYHYTCIIRFIVLNRKCYVNTRVPFFLNKTTSFVMVYRSYERFGLADSHHGFAMVLTFYAECC